METENRTRKRCPNAISGRVRAKRLCASVVSGVAAGLVLAAIAAIYRECIYAHERREQIAFFAIGWAKCKQFAMIPKTGNWLT